MHPIFRNIQYSLYLLGLFPLLTSCQTLAPERPLALPSTDAGIRFLLTFDDGPAASTTPCPTVNVLDSLRSNAVQRNVKAIFFVQTRAPTLGGAEAGKMLMRREHAEGHVLALHSGSVRGHINHTLMAPEELQQSLTDGMEDIARITGSLPLFVRPTFWRYNAKTLGRYENNGLNMVLSDIKAYDGNGGFFQFSNVLSSQRHGSMLSELQRVRGRIGRGELPVVNGVIPVIVTFHDTNSHTAQHLAEYMQILVEEARRAGLRVNDKPYYDSAEEIRTAALDRAEHSVILETRLPARLARFFKGT